MDVRILEINLIVTRVFLRGNIYTSGKLKATEKEEEKKTMCDGERYNVLLFFFLLFTFAVVVVDGSCLREKCQTNNNT